MKRNEIMDTIKTLARSQGFYGRLYNSIENSDNKDAALAYLENQNFRDSFDLIMFFES